MTFGNDGHDFLQKPPNIERQTTPADTSFLMQLMLREYLGDIRDELCRQNPSVLTITNVQGGNTINDIQNHVVKFEVGGKPVTVYKVLIWSQSEKAIRASVNSMATGADGFAITGALLTLHIPVFEMGVALNVAGTIGVNVPSNINADGSVFIYGFTTPDYPERQRIY